MSRMERLSEDQIKKAGIRYLKSYYRQRERSGSGKTFARYDVVTEGGIIADGHLSFVATNGQDFSATVEATSAATKDEVRCKLQYPILFWDSMAAASIVTALVFSYSYTFDQFTIKQIGLGASLTLLVALIVLLGLLFQWMFRNRRRYRYIYAIEQFKKYHADEQWIAIGEDVFEHPEDTILVELKDQCVINGFGLMVVGFDETVKMSITPSRNEVFGQKRERLSFEPRDEATRKGRIARFNQFWNRKVKTRIPGQSTLLRYQRGYIRQALLSGFAFLLIGGIFHREMEQTEFVFVDEKAYEDSLAQYQPDFYHEYDDPFVDTPSIDPLVKTDGYLHLEQTSIPDEYVTAAPVRELQYDVSEAVLLEIEAIPNEPFQVIIAPGDGLPIRYDCERLFNLRGIRYLVVDGVFTGPRSAQKRIARLNSEGISINAFNLSCFSDNKDLYWVSYDLFFTQKEEAQKAARQYMRLLKKKGLSNNKIAIRSIDIRR